MCCLCMCKNSFCFSGVICTANCSQSGKWFLTARVHRISPSLFKPVLRRLAAASTLYSTWYRSPLGPNSWTNTPILCHVSSQIVVSEIHEGLGWSPPEWYFHIGTPRLRRTCFGMWWCKSICRIHKGVRSTRTVLEDCVGLKEANLMKPTHSFTVESGLWFCLVRK